MAMAATERNGKSTLYGIHGPLHVEGAHLVDKNGEKVQLLGISTHNMNSFPEFVNDDAIEFMVDNWGMQLFRLAMYSAWADGDAGYADGSDAHREELEELIVKSVKKCAELGIYAMVDWHILFDYDPFMHKDMAEKFFDSISKKLSAYDNVIYEICNEPNMEQGWYDYTPEFKDTCLNWENKFCTWENIKAYANDIIPIIRKNVKDAVVVCGTPKWSQDVDTAADSPLEFDNVLYALHFYATTHKEELRKKAEYAMSKGCAIYITEFGICDAAGSGLIDYEEAGKWMRFAKENYISCSMWNLSNKDETSAMILPDCKKTSGWNANELSESGKWFAGLR